MKWVIFYCHFVVRCLPKMTTPLTRAEAHQPSMPLAIAIVIEESPKSWTFCLSFCISPFAPMNYTRSVYSTTRKYTHTHTSAQTQSMRCAFTGVWIKHQTSPVVRENSMEMLARIERMINETTKKKKCFSNFPQNMGFFRDAHHLFQYRVLHLPNLSNFI